MKIEKQEIVFCGSKNEIENLDNLMLCAKWVVNQFESINCRAIARIFEIALEDSYAWINTMLSEEALPSQSNELIHLEETEKLHAILVRYASINDPKVREDVLGKMMMAAEK